MQSPDVLTCSPLKGKAGPEVKVARSYYSICCLFVSPVILDFLLWKLGDSLGCLIRYRFLGLPLATGNQSL